MVEATLQRATDEKQETLLGLRPPALYPFLETDDVGQAPEELKKPSLGVRACLLYNKLFHLRAWFDRHFREMKAADHRWRTNIRQEFYRHAWDRYNKTGNFLNEFPGVTVKGKRLLDFGCGFGGSTLWYAHQGAKEVFAVDTYPPNVGFTREFVYGGLDRNPEKHPHATKPEKIHLRLGHAQRIPVADECLDLILTEDVVEHLDQPEKILEEWHRTLVPGGQVVMSFGPLWYHPHGEHLWEIFPAPWTHLLFPEKTCVEARNYLKGGGSGKTWRDLNFNQITLGRFQALLSQSKFSVEHFHVRAVWNLQPLLRVPWVGELFASQIECVLRK